MTSSLKNMGCNSNKKSNVRERKVPFPDKCVGTSRTWIYLIDNSGRNSDDKIDEMTIFLFCFGDVPYVTFMIDLFDLALSLMSQLSQGAYLDT